jgi:hypothetical protein
MLVGKPEKKLTLGWPVCRRKYAIDLMKQYVKMWTGFKGLSTGSVAIFYEHRYDL